MPYVCGDNSFADRRGILHHKLCAVLHYLGSAVSFVLIFVIIISDGKNMRGGFILTALLSVLYWIGGAVAAVVHSKHKKRAEDNRAYKSMFN